MYAYWIYNVLESSNRPDVTCHLLFVCLPRMILYTYKDYDNLQYNNFESAAKIHNTLEHPILIYFDFEGPERQISLEIRDQIPLKKSVAACCNRRKRWSPSGMVEFSIYLPQLQTL